MRRCGNCAAAQQSDQLSLRYSIEIYNPDGSIGCQCCITRRQDLHHIDVELRHYWSERGLSFSARGRGAA